jgi:hypothetical protein
MVIVEWKLASKLKTICAEVSPFNQHVANEDEGDVCIGSKW